MIDATTIEGRDFILGDKETIGVTNIRSRLNQSLAGTTGTISIFDPTGAEVLTNAALALTYTVNNTRADAAYTLLTGAGGTLTVAQQYKAVYKLTFPDGTVKQWEQVLTVKSNPF